MSSFYQWVLVFIKFLGHFDVPDPNLEYFGYFQAVDVWQHWTCSIYEVLSDMRSKVWSDHRGEVAEIFAEMAVFFINVCKFDRCGKVFPTLPDLIRHIEHLHLGKSPVKLPESASTWFFSRSQTTFMMLQDLFEYRVLVYVFDQSLHETDAMHLFRLFTYLFLVFAQILALKLSRESNENGRNVCLWVISWDTSRATSMLLM